jgi:hypothetical protein
MRKEDAMNAKKMIASLVLVAGLAFFISTWTPASSRPQNLDQMQANVLSSSPALSQIGFQGRLTNKSGEPLSGVYNLVFQAWDAPTGGTQFGKDTVVNNVPVNNGLFTTKVLLPQYAFSGDAVWLQIKVNGQIMSPRTELLPVPYALGLLPGASIRSESPLTALNIANISSGIALFSSSTNSFGVLGDSGTFGAYPTAGMHGVHGRGEEVGVYGEGGPVGVYGTGTGDGVKGVSANGRGLYGISTNIAGVRGESTNGNGVYGVTKTTAQNETSGVTGFSQYGTGVTGRSDFYNGIKAVTQSDIHSALAAGNEGAGPAIYAAGGSDGLAAIFKGNLQVRSWATDAKVVELGEGLDYSEGFDISSAQGVEPGMVLVIDGQNPGALTLSTQPYDRRVAGIVAGANGLSSAVHAGGDSFPVSVALAGRVYCYVDATYGAIQPGDLLTTSLTPGYAMRVGDYTEAQGAILGKAMEFMEEGERGLILVLVTLQ